MEAHKIILSATSPFFQNILKFSKHTHQLVHLEGFKGKELHSLLDFMYHGVADIYQDDLDLFLAKAEELQLKGITEGKEERKQDEEEEDKTLQAHAITSPDKTSMHKGNVKKEYLKNILDENELNSPTTTMATFNPSPNVSFNGGTAEDLKSTVWSLIA